MSATARRPDAPVTGAPVAGEPGEPVVGVSALGDVGRAGDRPPTVLSVFSTFAVGGPQVRFAAIANRFGRRYRHVVVSMSGDLACRERLIPELDVEYPAFDPIKGDVSGMVRRARALLQEVRPDVLVTANWGAIEWAMANQWPPGVRPFVRHVHMEDGFGPEEREHQIPRRVWTRRLVLRRSTVVLPSRLLWRIATERWRLPERRLRYVPNGVDLSRFTPGARDGVVAGGAGASASGAEEPVVGTVAALRAEKNLPRLLRAFAAAVADVPGRLVVVGGGPERPGLERLAAELGIADRVRFAGELTDPSREYAGFDAFALSSDTEQMPLSVLEAMAAGLPVAATDVGDVRAMLDPANGPYVVPKDDAALAGALRALLRDRGAARRVGAANRARAEREFDQETMFRTYAALFDGAA